jgi:hypothetical protein
MLFAPGSPTHESVACISGNLGKTKRTRAAGDLHVSDTEFYNISLPICPFTECLVISKELGKVAQRGDYLPFAFITHATIVVRTND